MRTEHCVYVHACVFAHTSRKWRWLEHPSGTHLPAVTVGSTRWTVGVIGVQTGSPHIGLAHLCLVQQLPEALQRGKGAQLLQQLLGVQVGPLDIRAAPGESLWLMNVKTAPAPRLLLQTPASLHALLTH